MLGPRNKAALWSLLFEKGIRTDQERIMGLLTFLGKKCCNDSAAEGLLTEAALNEYCAHKGVDQPTAKKHLCLLRDKRLLVENGPRVRLAGGVADLF